MATRARFSSPASTARPSRVPAGVLRTSTSSTRRWRRAHNGIAAHTFAHHTFADAPCPVSVPTTDPSGLGLKCRSHVLGSLWAAYRLVIDMGWWPTMGAGLPLEHRWLFITSLATALFCFGSSAVCHHFGGHARQSPAVLK